MAHIHPLWKNVFKDNPQQRFFFISDLHLGHPNIIKFAPSEGATPWRNYATIEEHDEDLVRRWNSVVRKGDVTIVLGDVTFRGLEKMKECNGKKLLILGNHDTLSLEEYMKYFEDVRGCMHVNSKKVGRIVLSHFPVHPFCLQWHDKANLYGHTHHSQVPDPRYVNVCVECVDFTPISALEIEERLEKSLDKSN